MEKKKKKEKKERSRWLDFFPSVHRPLPRVANSARTYRVREVLGRFVLPRELAAEFRVRFRVAIRTTVMATRFRGTRNEADCMQTAGNYPIHIYIYIWKIEPPLTRNLGTI